MKPEFNAGLTPAGPLESLPLCRMGAKRHLLSPLHSSHVVRGLIVFARLRGHSVRWSLGLTVRLADSDNESSSTSVSSNLASDYYASLGPVPQRGPLVSGEV